MSALLIVLVLAIVVYLTLGAMSRPPARRRDSVAEFNRALAALDPQERRRIEARRPASRRSPGAAQRSAPPRRLAA